MQMYDVIVAGLGGMGSATAFHLARRGLSVLGLDPFPPAHDRGASHGRSRIIREAYWEDPSYVPLVRRAYELWGELESASGRLLLMTTGGIMIGPRDSDVIQGTLASVAAHDLPHEVLDPGAMRARFPVFEPPDDVVGVLERRAGVLFPEECVTAHLGGAREAGADLRHGEALLAWSAEEDGVTIQTTEGRYGAGRLVLTVGPWAPQILDGLDLPFVIERQVVAWFRPARLAEAFEAQRCPIFIWELPGGRLFYGIPRMGSAEVKIAEHALGHPTTADTISREIHPDEIEEIRRIFIRPCMPAADGPAVEAITCMYTMTPDTHFIIDRHPEHDAVVVAAGFSGHGFKFTPVVGEILANLVTEERTAHDIALFAIDRFGPARQAHAVREQRP